MIAAPAPPNLQDIAGYYSQLAGVLAGFSFAGIVALATVRRRSNEQSAPIWPSVAPLTSAFIALVASSLNYAVMSGEVAGTRRLASLQSIAGMGFSIAGIMLVYSILILLSDLRRDVTAGRVRSAGDDSLTPDKAPDARWDPAMAGIGLLRNVVIIMLPAVLVLLMWGGVRDHLAHSHGPDVGFVTADWVAIGALAATLAVTIVCRVAFRTRPNDQGRTASRLANTAAQLAFLSLLGASGLITLVPSDALIPDSVPVAAMLVVAGFAVATAYSASRYQFAEDERPSRDAPSSASCASVVSANGGEPVAGAGADEHRTGGPGAVPAPLEPLTRTTLSRRSIEIFPQAYVMNISIIQGVALGVRGHLVR